ncbi:uncharacterized protein LOC122681451 isoform X1 [Cervus elaphus]|uniref:uncharacterized protein LOC122681451 isoform X1 n=1 Tax=Cervus elaphus TaxID=9860 RepID=UPI001CC27123|nr:uncharacterized protein LOC122681451 isoform X1 [Cervus elaphus]
MEKSRMNLPKGPDTLCSDKDEFMKVRPGGCAPRAEAGGLFSFPSGASSSCWAAHAPDQPPAGPRCLRSESFGLRKTLMSIMLCLTVGSESS